MIVRTVFIRSVFAVGTILAIIIRQGDADEPPSTRIVGGTDISISEIPFICSIRKLEKIGHWSWARVHLCGSTVVTERWQLTSAHCVFEKELASLLIVCGLRQVRSLERIEMEPDYADGQKGNDLALMLLKKPLVFTVNVQPIPLFAQPILPFSVAAIVGYGLSSDGTDAWSTSGLKAAIVPILTFDECSKRLGTLAAYLTSDTICTDNGLSASGACLGDSGGPVIVATELQSFNLLAIPAWTVTPCGSGPSMHTLISSHIDWILNIITPNLK